MNIDDLGTPPRGDDDEECFSVEVHRISDLPADIDIAAKYDTLSIPGFAISVAPVDPDPPYTPYMVSSSGPSVPTPTQSFIVESSNDNLHSAYYRPLLTPSAQIADSQRTLSMSYVRIAPDGSFLDPTPSPLVSDISAAPPTETYKYKPVAKKVKPVPTTLPEEFWTVRRIEGDPLADMPFISPRPLVATMQTPIRSSKKTIWATSYSPKNGNSCITS